MALSPRAVRGADRSVPLLRTLTASRAQDCIFVSTTLVPSLSHCFRCPSCQECGLVERARSCRCSSRIRSEQQERDRVEEEEEGAERGREGRRMNSVKKKIERRAGRVASLPHIQVARKWVMGVGLRSEKLSRESSETHSGSGLAYGHRPRTPPPTHIAYTLSLSLSLSPAHAIHS